MAEHPASPSRSSSVPRPHTPALSLHTSNPNIFSDEYAMEELSASPPASPADSIPDARETLTLSDPRPTPSHSLAAPAPRSIAFSSFPSRPSSMSKPPLGPQDGASSIPHRAVSSVSNADSIATRASTTSSYLSIPRSQSPYVGATGPSHPYALYPQVTRASSVTSESTIRPLESAFVAPAGPEHPYSMYPQNTVDEEHEDALAAGGPVGFPGRSQRYSANPRAAGNDVADLVGSDGHIEELPPYTRYADNVVSKGIPIEEPNAVVPTPPVVEMPMSPISQSTTFSDSGTRINTAAAQAATGDNNNSFTEKLRERSRRRVCCGVPLWIAIVASLLIVAVAALGGAIGTVLTRHTADSSHATPPSATTTVYLDGSPLQSTSGPMYPIPSGGYKLPTTYLNSSSNSCISNASYSDAWACYSSDGLPVYITDGSGPPQPRPASITFEPYQINGSFVYGPQPPNLPDPPYELAPFIDNDDRELGPALFLSALYCKLVIVHEDEYGPFLIKRSVHGTHDRRQRNTLGQPAQIGDKPWFCYFPDTVLELFIYDLNSSSQTTGSMGSATTSSPDMSMTGSGSKYSSMYGEQYSTYFGEYPPPYPSTAASTIIWPPQEKQQRSENDGLANYPRRVKIIDKRKPGNNTPPYCQQMEVVSEYSIVELNVPTLAISEIEPSETPASGPQRRAADVELASKRSMMSELDSYCFCEFFTP